MEKIEPDSLWWSSVIGREATGTRCSVGRDFFSFISFCVLFLCEYMPKRMPPKTLRNIATINGDNYRSFSHPSHLNKGLGLYDCSKHMLSALSMFRTKLKNEFTYNLYHVYAIYCHRMFRLWSKVYWKHLAKKGHLEIPKLANSEQADSNTGANLSLLT